MSPEWFAKRQRLVEISDSRQQAADARVGRPGSMRLVTICRPAILTLYAVRYGWIVGEG